MRIPWISNRSSLESRNRCRDTPLKPPRPHGWAVVFLSSSSTNLRFFRLVRGRVLILDHHGDWEGCHKTVDQYVQGTQHPCS